MLAELLLSVLLFTTVDLNGSNATLNVTCDMVAVDYGARPRAQKVPVTFIFEDKEFKRIWRYSVPMALNVKGDLLLTPAAYWVEEVRTSTRLELNIDGTDYPFDLTGSTKSLKDCEGM